MTDNINTLRRISTKLRKAMDSMPEDSLHVRIVLQRPYNNEKSIIVWDNVKSLVVMGKTSDGVAVLVARPEVEKKLRQIQDQLLELVRKK